MQEGRWRRTPLVWNSMSVWVGRLDSDLGVEVLNNPPDFDNSTFFGISPDLEANLNR
jgi:hypothetical protein